MVKSSFKFREQTKEINLSIIGKFGLKVTKGDVGIEIEVEGNKFPKQDPDTGDRHKLIPKQWGYHHDGSLRGKDNAEYVLKTPLPFDEVPEAVIALWKMFDEFGSVLDVSNRTSVHVHLNAQNFYLNRLCAFVALYMSVEDLLTEWCGSHRVGNLFCLRSKDAPAISQVLKEFLCGVKSMRMSPFPDGFHYAGLNLGALTKFGSLEVRTMRGATTPEEVIRWVEVLRHIYDLSESFEDPRAICENFSGHDPYEYAKMVLGQHCDTIITETGFTTDRLRGSLYEGIRIAQDLCYCRDWSDYVPTKIAPDPFRRNPKKVLESMGMAASQPSPTFGSIAVTHAQLQEYYNNATISLDTGAWASVSPIQYPSAPPAAPVTLSSLSVDVQVEVDPSNMSDQEFMEWAQVNDPDWYQEHYGETQPESDAYDNF